MKSLLARLQHIFLIKFTMDVFARFGKDNGGLLAAGLSFFLVIAFVPLLLVGLWALGTFFLHSPDAAVHKIKDILANDVLPGGGAKTEAIHLMERAGIVTADGESAGPTLLHIMQTRGIAGIIGVLGVIWAAMQIFVNGAVAMNAAWETHEKRNWLVLHLVTLGLLIGTIVLMGVSLGATAVSTWFSSGRFGHIVPGESVLFTLLGIAVSILLSGLMYAVIFKFLPATAVPWKAALVAGYVTACAWEVAKQLLARFLLRPNHSLYGELGNLIVFILWIYYSMMILLLGAEVSRVYTDEVEKMPLTRLKRTAHGMSAVPTSSAALSPDSPLARQKERNRAERIRKTGRKAGQQARR